MPTAQRAPRPWRLGAVMLVAALAGACAGAPVRPDFRAALAELRIARRLLQEAPAAAPVADEVRATAQIDDAIALIHQRIEPRGPVAPAAAPDAAWTRVERVHLALEHLDSARLLLTREEYDAGRHVLRNEAISCIARAEEALGRTLEVLLR